MKKVLLFVIITVMCAMCACTYANVNEEEALAAPAPTQTPEPTPTPDVVEDVQNAEMTLSLAFGERSGVYSGTVKNGVPNGEGVFKTENGDGDDWSAEGTWRDGHMQGHFKIEWENGQIKEGEFKNDLMEGEGELSIDGVLVEKGRWKNGELKEGTLYDDLGDPYFEGRVKNDFPVETAEEREARKTAFAEECAEFDEEKWLENKEAYVGTKVRMKGDFTQNWESEAENFCESMMKDDISGAEADVYYRGLDSLKYTLAGAEYEVWGIVTGSWEYTVDGEAREAPVVQAIFIDALDA